MADFVYGDSCTSGDDKYVIAQFRQDAPMAWVAELRAFLIKDELKWKYFLPERHRVSANKSLWRRVQAGVERAEITIIDPLAYRDKVQYKLQRRGAEYGVDFNDRAIRELTSDELIDDSPLATIRYLKFNLMANALNLGTCDGFSTVSIRQRVGGKQKDALVTAARAHAMISPTEKLELIRLCMGYETVYLTDRVDMIRRMGRVFDVEHANSVDVLNDFSERIAQAAQIPDLPFLGTPDQIVREARSEDIDHIQGADFAAGWAVDMLLLTDGDYRGLAAQFSYVSVNGIIIPG